jgi:hypothetical protein
MSSSVDLLELQIGEARRSIASDGYPMSVGELTNLYRDQELRIRPEFQRIFRWTELQKSRLIESILLGIPLPSIFVAQAEDGRWELVDGLQRVSTLLELQGELLDEKGEKVPHLVLRSTKYLSALEGRVWLNKAQPELSLSEAQRLDIKRSKLDVKIIKRESSPQTKFDLFQRLNSYGSPLTAQEVRSALIIAVSPNFFSWLEALANYPPFRESTALSERLMEERFDLELLIRFIVLHNRPKGAITMSLLRDFSQFLDDESVALASAHPQGSESIEKAFKQTFDVIADNGGEKIFKKWDAEREEFRGPFLGTAFEIFALGIGYHVAHQNKFRTDLLVAARELWNRPDMQGGFATGRSTERRLVQFIPIGRDLLRL